MRVSLKLAYLKEYISEEMVATFAGVRNLVQYFRVKEFLRYGNAPLIIAVNVFSEQGPNKLIG